MLDGLIDLAAATAVFVFGHLLLSSQALRPQLVERLGEGAFRGLYSLVMIAAFVWMVLAYGRAPYEQLWLPGDWARWLAIVVMPLAFMLLVGGLTTPSPTLVGGDKVIEKAGSRSVVQGFLTVTRHGFLCATTLWAVLHFLANGDVATAILTGGIVVLSVAGMWHIDHRRQLSLGADWGPIALTTSQLPFLAAIQKRTRIDWRGIGWWRPALAIVLYLLFLFGHQHLVGVPVIYF